MVLMYTGLSVEVIDASSNEGGSVIFTSPLGAVMEVPANTLSEVGHAPMPTRP